MGEHVNMVSLIMDYEAGTLTPDQGLTLFSELVASGMAWKLQGSYGRTAHFLISQGYLDSSGRILEVPAS